MVNIADISKPSVAAKGGGTARLSKTAKKIEETSAIDATRKVDAATRQSKKQKKNSEAENDLNETLSQEESNYDARGKTKKSGHLDLKA